MGGGTSKAAEQASIQNAQMQTQLGQKQMGLEQQYADLAKGELARRTQLEAPLVNFYQALTSGDKTAQMAAVAPQLGTIAQQTKQAGSNIMNQVPAGAGRDYALAQNQIGQGQQAAGVLNNAFTSALQGEAQLGAEALGAGLNQEGASLSAASGATSSLGASNQAYGTIQQTEAARKASTLGFLGELAGAGGRIGAVAIGKSDVRLKEDIVRVGQLGDVNLYTFRFKGDGAPRLGVLAQEVYTKHPDSVVVGGRDPSSEPWLVKYHELIPQLVKPED